MSKYTQEQYDELPEFMKSDLVKDGDFYVHSQVVSLKKSLNSLDSKMKDEVGSLNEQLRERIEAEEKIAEQARKEAYEKAKAENNIDEIMRMENEKLQDAQRLLDEQKEAFETEKQSLSASHKDNIASRLAKELATPAGSKAFEQLIKHRLKVNHLGQVDFLNDDGSASSLDEEQFKERLKGESIFSPLLSAGIVSSSPNLINGSNGGSATTKNPKDMNSAERLQLKKENPQLFRKIFNL